MKYFAWQRYLKKKILTLQLLLPNIASYYLNEPPPLLTEVMVTICSLSKSQMDPLLKRRQHNQL